MNKKRDFDNGVKNCLTCMFADEYAFSVSKKGYPQTYEREMVCGHAEMQDKRVFTCENWEPCSFYKKCTERQAEYLDIFDEETQTIIPNPYL